MKSLYYNPQKMLSYNRILNFIIGARGIGKSFAMKEHPIRRFLKNGEQFIYLRRFKTELKKVDNYFADIEASGKFPGVTFEVKGRTLLINEKVAGWAVALSTWQNEKSNSYPNVSNIIFDEFIREKDNSGYLPNEVDALLNFMDTVFRDRDNVRCVCLSNSVSLVNPYFIYFNLMPNTDKRYNAYRDILVEIPDSEDFANYRRNTKFGRLIDGTEYGDMSLNNEFVNDSTVFIEKRTKESRFQFSLVYKGLNMGVWVDLEQGLMYLSQDFDPSSRLFFAMTTDDFNENALLMDKWKDNYYLKKMVSAFKNGYLRFDNQVIRNTAYEMFKKMGVQ